MTFKSVIKPFKNIWQVIGAMVLLNTVFLYFFWPNAFQSWQGYGIGLIWGSTIWVTQSVGNSAVFHFLDDKIPWRKSMFQRGIVTILSVGTYSALAYLVVQTVMYAIFVPTYTLQQVFENTLGSTWITLAISYTISFVLTFIGFARALVKSEIEKERLQTEMMTYKYESLRNQINPHFLFNSFNVLSELVYENQELAVKFIRQLSDLYRYVLDAKDKDLVAITDELNFIKSFTFLLKTRFENRVDFHIDSSVETEGFIVPMALQLLIENCIKHNEATSTKPLIITVKREGDTIKVTNNLQLKKWVESSTKIGLKNLKERYAYFESHPIEISQSDTEYAVCIPILQVN
tara:strand:- start:5852 stop:6892 length:1041 start_codon:yes stop_codon:yes gene_type:complete